jgi:hypothetical protein
MRRIAITTCLAGLLLGVSSGPAGAATLSPTSANFGTQAVGSVSAPRSFTLTPDLLDLLPLTIATTGDFRQTNTCPAALQFVSGPCTINVTFAPRADGDRAGTLSTTTLVLGGPSATLRGTATQGGKGDGKQGVLCKAKGKKKKKGKGKKKRAAVSKKKGKKKKKGKGCKKKGKGKKKKKGKKK